MPRSKINRLIFVENHNLLVTWPKDGAEFLIGGITYLKMRNFFYHWDLDSAGPDAFENFQLYMEDACPV